MVKTTEKKEKKTIKLSAEAAQYIPKSKPKKKEDVPKMKESVRDPPVLVQRGGSAQNTKKQQTQTSLLQPKHDVLLQQQQERQKNLRQLKQMGSKLPSYLSRKVFQDPHPVEVQDSDDDSSYYTACSQCTSSRSRASSISSLGRRQQGQKQQQGFN